MWSYFGSKFRVVKYYPEPKHSIIIEPFAGTAQYAFRYWNHEVILVDRFPIIVNLWHWLQKCTEQDVLDTRIIKYGENLDDFKWDCIERKHLVGYLLGGGSARPRKTPTKWKTTLNPNFQRNKLEKIAKNLYKIKHWKIIEGSYSFMPNRLATWFIDPPYINSGNQYTFGSDKIDYECLANWCKERVGQIIVCEATGASWLDFSFLCDARGLQRHKEVVWIKEQ